MYSSKAQEIFRNELDGIRRSGLYKDERILRSPQGSQVETDRGPFINLCANNYLGMANDPEVVAAARRALDERGFGMASVRFICGTQDLHKQLERKIAEFFGTDDAILYASCFDANGGLFETLLGPEDAVISDALNHASIIDGIRLCKARRLIYPHGNVEELEKCLQQSQDARLRLIATDGVFSMHGDFAPLPQICELAEKYDALVMIDDCHATGFIGETGRGTPEHFGVQGRVDIITSTLGKAVGGASGGFTTGRREIIELLRQRSRPYLFSNSVAPPIVAASIQALEIIDRRRDLIRRLHENTAYFRRRMREAGFPIPEGTHPIVPIMLGDEKPTVEMARRLNERGILVVGFSYPVVPKGEARIRVQVSAAHTREQLDAAVDAFTEVAREMGWLR
ncbi:MAG: glycine C-acetyltransferase [Acidobacteriota bacterium]